MALVAYSDSEDSDTEPTPTTNTAPKATAAKTSEKGGFQKAEGRKIKVDLPNVKPETTAPQDEPPAKRARTGGAFSGFNSLLPAPKKAAQSAPKAGVNLKTSSEAAFSRAPAQEEGDPSQESSGHVDAVVEEAPSNQQEAKVVGKATKFKPLSVANKKKPMKKSKPVEERDESVNGAAKQRAAAETAKVVQKEAPPPPKPKRSLFSVPAVEEANPVPDETTGAYESMTKPSLQENSSLQAQSQSQHQTAPAQSNPNSLESLASDLNLTAAQRRQLFGRNAKGSDINIAHFNMDNEYAANEELRQAGEVVEHKAVKAIAPGKHSLQQLVNNARSQQDNLQDKWAEGRRERGEGGSKYGWAGR